MTDQILAAISKAYPLKELDCGSFATCKVSGIMFQVRQFEAAGLGNVSVMSGSGMLGAMKMDTLIVNPFDVDAPLFSYDRIHAMGNDTLFLEIFETRLNPTPAEQLRPVVEAYKDLPDSDAGVHWYEDIRWKESVKKVGKKKDVTARYDAMTADFVAAFLAICKAAPACDRTAKMQSAAAYTEGLLKNGGPAADSFLKAYGPEKTGELFRSHLFATGTQA